VSAAAAAAAAARGEPSASAASSVSTTGDDIDSSELFLVGPLQGIKILESFAPLTAASASAARNSAALSLTLSLTLDIDTRRQSVRGVCHLPHGLKSSNKLLVFCSDFDAAEMLEAGADFAGMNELLQRIGKGWTGFDRCIATPAVMPQVMKVAKVLGPRKLMPNPKSGTLVTDLKRAIIEAKSGTLLEYRTLEIEPRIDVKIGSLESATTVKNLENMKFFVREVLKQKSRGGANSSAASSASGDLASGRLTTIGGISMLPNIEKLNRLLHLKEKESSSSTASSGGFSKGKGLFIKSAYLQLGNEDNCARVDLDPERILPSSPAYYR